MKAFNDDSASIFDLKYDNLFKIFEEVSSDRDAEEEEDEEEEETENGNLDEVADENEEIEIEISSGEYNRKISNLMAKLNKALNNNIQPLKTILLKNLDKENSEFKSIKLAVLIELLGDNFQIILDQIDVYCVFNKFRHDENNESEFIEEVIDYDKFIMEVEKSFKDDKDRVFYLEKSTDDKNPIENEDFIQVIKNFLNKTDKDFEKFIKEEEDSIIKLKLNENTSNRYIDIQDFENLLIVNGLVLMMLSSGADKLKINKRIYNFTIDDDILFSKKKINLDYLKFIIEDFSISAYEGYEDAIKLNQIM